MARRKHLTMDRHSCRPTSSKHPYGPSPRSGRTVGKCGPLRVRRPIILCARGRGGGSDGRGEAWAVATLDDGTLDEPAASALAEYRWATFRLEVVLFLDGYWQEIAASAAAGGGGRSAQEEERLMLEGLVAEITC